MNVPDDISSLEIKPYKEDEKGLDHNLCRVYSMNLIVDVFMSGSAPYLTGQPQADICMYAKALFDPEVSHDDMHKRIVTYVEKLAELRRKFAGTEYNDALGDLVLAESRYTLLPLLEK